MKEQYRNDCDELILFNNAVAEYGIKIPELSAYSGDMLFFKTDNDLSSNFLYMMFSGLVRMKSGKALVAGAEPVFHRLSRIVSVFPPEYVPCFASLDELVFWYAGSRNFSPPSVLSEFKRMLDLFRLGYVYDADIKNLSRKTRGKLSALLSLSVPSVIVCVQDPFLYLEDDENDFFMDAVFKLRSEGSAVVIISCAELPADFKSFKTINFGIKGYE